MRSIKRVNIGAVLETKCSKNYQTNSRLGNGVVLFWCGRHRICLGWVFLQSAESLEIVYTTLLARFPVLPKIICYDNACNLAEYCYNRAPRYVFLVSLFHSLYIVISLIPSLLLMDFILKDTLIALMDIIVLFFYP